MSFYSVNLYHCQCGLVYMQLFVQPLMYIKSRYFGAFEVKHTDYCLFTFSHILWYATWSSLYKLMHCGWTTNQYLASFTAQGHYFSHKHDRSLWVYRPTGFEPTNSASLWPQTHVLGLTATGIGLQYVRPTEMKLLIEHRPLYSSVPWILACMIPLCLLLTLEYHDIQNHNTSTCAGGYRYTILRVRNADIHESV